MRELCYLHIKFRKPVRKIMRGCLAINRCIERKDNLADAPLRYAADQALDIQFIRPDPIKRREGATQNVIAPAESGRALQRPEIGDIFDDAQHGRLTLRIPAYGAGVRYVEIAAFLA